MLVIFILPITTWAADRYVDDNGVDAGNCQSNLPSCRTIQYAIDVSNAGDKVYVNSGMYVENIDFMGKAITVQSLHGPSNTIIDGNDNTSVVKFNSFEDENSVLDGFTIQHGSACGENTCYIGGGITIVNSSPTIKNCKIRFNTADGNGAGIFIFWNSSPTITNCEIANNQGGSGAGIYIRESSSVKITNCDIRGNTITTVHGGAGIYVGKSSVTITNSTIRGNSAHSGGGGIVAFDSTLILKNCTITGNKSRSWTGGGISSINSSPSSISRIDVVNCTISGNRAATDGGAIHLGWYGTTLSVVNSILWNNSAGYDGNDIFNNGGNNNIISVTYTDLADHGLQYPWSFSIGNISQNPKFKSSLGPASAPFTGGDYHLQSGSPAIDQGTSDKAAYPLIPANDIDGDFRPLASSHDMGSDEYKKFGFWQYFKPKMAIRNTSSNACDSTKNGTFQKGTLTLYISEPGYQNPKEWAEIPFDDVVAPGQKVSLSFNWPKGKVQPSDNATLYMSYETVITVNTTSQIQLEEQGFAVGVPTPTPAPRPTPTATPAPVNSYTVYAFSPGTESAVLPDKPPYLKLDLSDNNRLKEFPLFGSPCQDPNVGAAYFSIDPNKD